MKTSDVGPKIEGFAHVTSLVLGLFQYGSLDTGSMNLLFVEEN